ncbi:hypothetical protein GCM10010280_43490 [Streptomyces pilosus]|uniref:Uncharacterized protein n=1 Tax=Streptomyces pilosus TaxID=28893 RepID=A0A918BVM2_9ACTN|nr:hypothetical protein GCM10010280_43490 [Streptomyces pilosus]
MFSHFPPYSAPVEAASKRRPLRPALRNVPGLSVNVPRKIKPVKASAKVSACPSLRKLNGSSEASFQKVSFLKYLLMNLPPTSPKMLPKSPANAPATADWPMSVQSNWWRRRSGSSGAVMEISCEAKETNASWIASSSTDSGVGMACPSRWRSSRMVSAVRAFWMAISVSDVPPVKTASAAIRASSMFIRMNSRRIWYFASDSLMERSICREPSSRSSSENFCRWFWPSSSTKSFIAATNSPAIRGGSEFPAVEIAPFIASDRSLTSSASRL